MNKDYITQLHIIKEKKNIEFLCGYTIKPEIGETADCWGDLKTLYNHCRQSSTKLFFYCGPDYIINYLQIIFKDFIFFKRQEEYDCTLYNNISKTEISELKQMYPDAQVALYYKSNLNAALNCDYLFDDNGLKEFIDNTESKELIVVPDYNVGYRISSLTDKSIIVSHGSCAPVAAATVEIIRNMQLKHPDYKIIAHPESSADIQNIADYVMGYEEAYDFFKDCRESGFITVFERNFFEKIKKDFPRIKFARPDKSFKCKGAKDISFEEIINSINKLEHRVSVPDEIAYRILPKLNEILKKY